MLWIPKYCPDLPKKLRHCSSDTVRFIFSHIRVRVIVSSFPYFSEIIGTFPGVGVIPKLFIILFGLGNILSLLTKHCDKIPDRLCAYDPYEIHVESDQLLTNQLL